MAAKKTLKERYESEILPQLMKELGVNNKYQVPALQKIVINIGLGESTQNSKAFDAGLNDLQLITGQKPLICRAKKSIATFKVRQGMPIGVRVTLRGKRMYDFYTKLVEIVLPRVRDFKGLNEKAFDGHGNYNIGLKDQLVFPEIEYDKIDKLRGMNITIVTSANTDIEGKALLKAMGMPFRHQRPQTSQAAA